VLRFLQAWLALSPLRQGVVLLKYASRNACEFVNCESLFFVEDLFPLSAGPEAGGEAPPAEEAGGGGH